MQKLVDGALIDLTDAEVRDFRQREADALVEEQARVQAEKAEYMQEFRDMRRELLNVLTGIAIAEGLLEDFKVLRQALLDMPQAEEVALATTAAEAKTAIKIEYAKAVALAPKEFITAFKELDQ